MIVDDTIMPSRRPVRIAVIGAGISGLTAAYLLAPRAEISLFEAGECLGGHTATRELNFPEGQLWVDTGFIVFNDRTYPNFINLLQRLGVEYQPTEMGFSVCDPKINYEYSGTSLAGFFAQPRNLVKRDHWRMFWEILRFNRLCTQLYRRGTIEQITLGEFLCKHKFGPSLRHYYILPMVSAIWSSGVELAAEIPLDFFIRFFINHGLLTVTDQPQWYTIKGGSKSYIPALTARFQERIFTNTPINQVRRNAQGVVLSSRRFGDQHFDKVIFACHSDQALAMLADPSTQEQEILSAIPYLKNKVVLHSDKSVLPRSRAAWASWNYQIGEHSGAPGRGNARLTYNMNILQKLVTKKTICVSVNPGNAIAEEKIHGVYEFSHPLFTRDSINAQARWSEISGVSNSYYCGAYWANGFHEDGVVSALKVVQQLGLD